MDGRSGECTGMDWLKIAPRQLLLRCSTAYIHVGVHFLHFRHPWRSYTARGQDDVQDVQVSREAMDGRKRLAGAVNVQDALPPPRWRGGWRDKVADK
jgi:hypothetical protein